jgi:large subunit ribosomal protein L31
VKEKIHPKWFPEAKVHCACGSACHPLFTGQQKFVDTAGRVDKFRQREEIAKKKQQEAAARKAKREAAKTEA